VFAVGDEVLPPSMTGARPQAWSQAIENATPGMYRSDLVYIIKVDSREPTDQLDRFAFTARDRCYLYVVEPGAEPVADPCPGPDGIWRACGRARIVLCAHEPGR
jgi:hypothetical protein